MSHEIIVEPNGMARFIYGDDIAEVMRDVGLLSVDRASHVEPTSDGQWSADMSPVGGPELGPFTTRREALATEVAWLKANDIPVPVEV